MDRPFLLYIDAAEQQQLIGLSAGERWLGQWHSSGDKQAAHALHTLIQTAMAATGNKLSEIDAVVVNNGPGSYTGLRIGLATAKGLCYALDKPLLLLNHLELIADQLFDRYPDAEIAFPLIDARRMDAFAAAYTREGKILVEPTAMTLDAAEFIHIAGGKRTVLGGSGSGKLKQFISGQNFTFDEQPLAPVSMMAKAVHSFRNGRFTDVRLSTPFYFKAFYTPQKK